MTDTTPYERELRKAMTALEAIAADTDTPTPVRIAAITRVLTFWTAIRDEMQRKGKEHDDAE